MPARWPGDALRLPSCPADAAACRRIAIHTEAAVSCTLAVAPLTLDQALLLRRFGQA